MRAAAEILLTEEERERYLTTVGNWYEDAHRNPLHGPCRHSCQEVLDAIRALIEAYQPKPKITTFEINEFWKYFAPGDTAPGGFIYYVSYRLRSIGVEVVEGEKADEKRAAKE